MTPEHEKLLLEMESYIKELSGISYSAAYADNIPESDSRVLAKINTVPATYIRTRSDRICFFQDRPLLFEYDAKTNMRGTDFFVECLPVWHHLVAYHHFNLMTVYGFRWPNSDFPDIGIILDDNFRRKVDAVFVYEREAVKEVTRFVSENHKKWFPKSRLVRIGNRRGSGDPSVKISRNALGDCRHWKSVISELCAQ